MQNQERSWKESRTPFLTQFFALIAVVIFMMIIVTSDDNLTLAVGVEPKSASSRVAVISLIWIASLSAARQVLVFTFMVWQERQESGDEEKGVNGNQDQK